MIAPLLHPRRVALVIAAASALVSPRAGAQAPPDLPPLGAGPSLPVQPSAPPVAPPAAPRPYHPAPMPGPMWMSPAEVPPGFAMPPGQYPQGYYPPLASRPEDYNLPPPPPRRRHDTGMFASGVVMVSVGVVGAIVGAVMVSSAANRIDIYCDAPSVPCAHKDDDALKTAGALMMAGSAILGAAGIPLWAIGSRMVPVAKDGAPPPRAARLPELHIGPGTATVLVRF